MIMIVKIKGYSQTSHYNSRATCLCIDKFNKQHHRKVLLSSFHLNGHTLGFHLQTKVRTILYSIMIISIILKLYSPRYPVNITFSRRGHSAKSHFSFVVYPVLARYSILFGVQD